MYSLVEGFKIAMYSCKHNTRADITLIIHKNHAVKLILIANTRVCYNKTILHATSKSRNYTDETNIVQTREDMHLIVYS